MTSPRTGVALVLLAALTLAGGAASADGRIPGLQFLHGILAGDITDTRAAVWTRTGGSVQARLEYAPSPGLIGATTVPLPIGAQADFTAKVELGGLQPDTRYYYRAVAEAGNRRTLTRLATFRTAPSPAAAEGVAFAWGADLSGRFKPFRIFDAIRAQQPQFFLFLGDTVYADIDSPGRTLDDYRGVYRRNREDDSFQTFMRAVPVYAVWDDHEVANNFDRTHPRIPIGRQAFFEYWPVRVDPSDPARLYRSVRWGKLVEVFILDTRQYRAPASDRDTPAKSMLGPAQKGWLLDGLRSSDAVFKVIASSVPLKYHGVDSWEGYRSERQELFDFIAQNGIRRVVVLCGDVHYAAVLRHDVGIVEAIAGPLAMFINRRRPAAGEPETEFTYSGSFSFGLVRVAADPPALTIELYNIDGRLLHRTIVSP